MIIDVDSIYLHRGLFAQRILKSKTSRVMPARTNNFSGCSDPKGGNEMRRLIFTSILIAYFANLSVASAQSTNATVGGTVTDPSMALIPGVEVSVRNVATGIVNTTTTNEAGAYQFASLQTGTYEISASLPGFRKSTIKDVVLGGGQQVRMNFTLQLGSVGTTVDVTATADTMLASTSASIGTVMGDKQVRDLPLGNRNVLELLAGMAGTGATEGDIEGNFAGNRLSAVNVTRDGMTVSTGRYLQGTLAATYMSPDLVEEVKVTVAPVGGEGARGSGQVQMVTRSGANQFRGSAFWNNRNSALDSANWFNNFNGAASDWENRNQYGFRLGGPIVKNKTFFFFLIDNQRTAIRQNYVGTVLTGPARQGIFRYFPGTADNRNAQQNNPTVDLQGNPVKPTGATADLQSIDVFSYDPLRPGFDPSGWIQNVLLTRMPLPNDYTVGDGLNTAGIRFTRRLYGLDTNIQDTVDRNNRDQFNLRLDHNFSSAHKLSFVYTRENSKNRAEVAGIEQWPGGYQGANHKYPRIYTGSLVSTISPALLNEFHAGWRLHDVRQWAPFYVGRDRDIGAGDAIAQEAFALLPQYNGVPLQPVPQFFPQGFMNLSAGFGTTRGSWSPLTSFSDTLSWVRGRHALKMGFELRRDRTEGWNDNNFTPLATIGAGNNPAPITNVTIPGMTTNNATTARNLLYNLAGSIDNIRQGFDLTSAAAPLKFLGYQDGVKLKNRDWRATELSVFFKDEWKVTPNVTLNFGLGWDYYGVPYEANGLAGRVVDGYKGLCGIGCGALTTVELVGKNSPQPDKQLFNDDWNNFAPSVGFSWSVPGLGGGTVLRGGYGISYSGAQFQGAMGVGGIDAGGGTLPGLSGISGGNGLTYTQTSYWSLANAELPFQPQFEPLSPVPLTDSRTLTMNLYEPNRRTPYIQNFNLSIQRRLARDLILDVSYVGSKGTKLYARVENNVEKIFETEFLDAFNVTRTGGNHPLFDRMLMGLTIPGAGVVNGTTLTGSAALRLYTNTRANLANGNAGAVADFLNRSTNAVSAVPNPNVTGKGGGFIRNGGLPEDFLVFNPQFQGAGINGNPSSSTYHSLQVQVTKRTSYGFTTQASYTLSKNLGEGATDGTISARDPRNRALDKSLLTFHRTHIFTSNGTYSLPFGPNRAFLSGGPAWMQRLVEQWQAGAIVRWSSGAPLGFTTQGANIWSATSNTPNILGQLPEGKVTTYTDGRLPTYFTGLTQSADPGRAGVTTVNTLVTAYNRLAIFDAQGNPVLVNPAPGQVGSLGIRTIDGPARFQFDMNLSKRIRISENRDLEFRADVVNILNHPVFGNPNLNINSANFGQIDSADPGRRFTLGARVNF